MILIDDDHGHEALARIGQRDGRRAGIEVEHGVRVERVAVGPDAVDVDRAAAPGSARTCQSAPRLTKPPKYLSVSARLKLSAVTGTDALAPLVVAVVVESVDAILASRSLDGLDVRQLPVLVEERSCRARRGGTGPRISPGAVGTQFASLPAGAFGPK